MGLSSIKGFSILKILEEQVFSRVSIAVALSLGFLLLRPWLKSSPFSIEPLDAKSCIIKSIEDS